MNPHFKDKVDVPRINWDRVLIWSAVGIFIVTAIGLVSRRRSLLIAAELIDFVVITALILLAAYAFFAKSNNNKRKPNE